MSLPGGSLGLTGGPRGLTGGPHGVATETSGLSGGPRPNNGPILPARGPQACQEEAFGLPVGLLCLMAYGNPWPNGGPLGLRGSPLDRQKPRCLPYKGPPFARQGLEQEKYICERVHAFFKEHF